MSFHVPYQGEGHGMSSHVSGGRRVGDHPGGGTWDELPCEWGEIREGGAKINPSLLMGDMG